MANKGECPGPICWRFLHIPSGGFSQEYWATELEAINAAASMNSGFPTLLSQSQWVVVSDEEVAEGSELPGSVI
jgi:hypothetical protein